MVDYYFAAKYDRANVYIFEVRPYYVYTAQIKSVSSWYPGACVDNAYTSGSQPGEGENSPGRNLGTEQEGIFNIVRKLQKLH